MPTEIEDALAALGFFGTRTAVAAATIPPEVGRIIVNGALSVGDVRSATYRRASPAQSGFEGVLTSADGAKWIFDEPELYPEWFGAKGDARQLTDGAISAGSTTFTSASAGFTASDVGKYIMIAGAGSGRQHATTIAAVTNATTVTLAAGAVTTVSGAAWFFGTTDDTALQTLLDFVSRVSGKAVLTAGKTYLLRSAALRYRDNSTIILRGDLLHANANNGGFALQDQYFRIDPAARTQNVSIFFEGGAIIFPDAWTSDAGGLNKKGLGITNTIGFEVRSPRTVGNNASSFATQVSESSRGNWIGSRITMGDGLGEDGIHLFGNCADINFSHLVIYAGDDAFSLTQEIATGLSNSNNAVIENITVANSILCSNGFSSIKILTNTNTGAAKIRNVTFENCIGRSAGGATGQVIIIANGGFAQGCEIRDIKIVNCQFDKGPSTQTAAQIAVSYVRGFELVDTIMKGSYDAFLRMDGCVDSGARGCRFIQTVPPVAAATGLVVSSIGWLSGNSVAYRFSGSPDLSAVTTSHWLSVSGAVNALNNGVLDITAVDPVAKTITVTNYKVSSTVSDETTGATASALSVLNSAAIILNSCENCWTEGNRINDYCGNVLIQSRASVLNPFTGVTQSRGMRISGNGLFGCVVQTAVEVSVTVRSRVDGNYARGSWGNTFVNELTGSLGNEYVSNSDLDAGFGRTGSLVPGSGSEHAGNRGWAGDKILGTITVPAGQTKGTLTLTRERFFMSNNGDDLRVAWLQVTPKGAFAPQVTLSGMTYTLTLPSAATASTSFDYRLMS